MGSVLKLGGRRSPRFTRDENGAVAPIIGLGFVMLILATGFAVDVGRGTLVKARLSDALDAAGLAVGAKLSSTSDYNAEALRYVTANFKSGYAGATVDGSSVKATVSTDKTTITLSASATVPTAFMRIVGSDVMKVSAASEVRRKTTGLEVALALDTTGSMSGSMSSLKSAANNLVDTLFGTDSTAENLFISVVPFSHTVNIGSTRSSWVNFDYGNQKSWGGCVMARAGGLDQSDQPPSTSGYKFSDYTGGSSACPTPLLPPQNTKSIIKSKITSLTSGGNTHTNLGAVWGWRLLSPSWQGYWGSASWKGNTLPLKYDTDKMQKALVLMTDGENTMSNTYTAYKKLSDGVLGTTDQSSAISELNKRLENVCSKMKIKGIIIYTIAFRNPDAVTKALLQSCATSTSFYFDAGNDAALAQAFARIADSLSNLRVSK